MCELFDLFRWAVITTKSFDLYLVYSEPTTRAYSAPTPRRSHADTRSFSSVWSCWKRQYKHCCHHWKLNVCYFDTKSNPTNAEYDKKYRGNVSANWSEIRYHILIQAVVTLLTFPLFDLHVKRSWVGTSMSHTYRQLEQQSAVPVWCLLGNLDGLAQ